MLSCTFMNQGTPYDFHPHAEMWRFSHYRGKVSALKMHAEIALHAMESGTPDVFIISPTGARLTRDDLRECIQTNRLPAKVMPAWMRRRVA